MTTQTHQTPKVILANLKKQIEEAGIAVGKSHRREGAQSLDVAVPGERWEIDVLEDGSIEVEVFKSDGTIEDKGKLQELLARFGEPAPSAKSKSSSFVLPFAVRPSRRVK